MQLHTFTARSLAEALRLVRKELGPDASVLHTRELRPSISRWISGKRIEVTASSEAIVPSRLTATSDYRVEDQRVSVPRAELDDFRRKVRGDLKVAAQEPSLVEQLAGTTADHFADLRQRLKEAGVGDATAQRWLSRLQAEFANNPRRNSQAALTRLRQIVAADLPIRRSVRAHQPPNVIALVGPTGVGKTTTLAKLSARFHYGENKSVALITVDTYRVAALEQIHTYAQIMNLPLEVIHTPSELAEAAERLSGHDVVLIDTAGQCPLDDLRLNELRTILASARPHEVALVLSGSADIDCSRTTAQAFAAAGASSLILTKLDELSRPGRLGDLLDACRLPLWYTASGQDVPHDIEPASAPRLADLILATTDS